MTEETNNTQIDDITSQYIGKQLLSYVQYPPADEDSYCRVFPQYVYDENEGLTKVNDQAFPTRGGIHVRTKVNMKPSWLENNVGSFTLAKLDVLRNSIYENPQHVYFTNLSEKNGIRLDNLNDYDAFCQIIKVEDPEELLSDKAHGKTYFIKLKKNEFPARAPYALISIPINGEEKFYGPFEISGVRGGYELSVPESSDFFAGIFSSEDIQTYPLVDTSFDNITTVARFALTKEVTSKFKKLRVKQKIDWLPNETIINVIGRAINTANNLENNESVNFSNAAVKAIKASVSAFNDSESKMPLTKSVTNRVNKFIDTAFNWYEFARESSASVKMSVEKYNKKVEELKERDKLTETKQSLEKDITAKKTELDEINEEIEEAKNCAEDLVRGTIEKTLNNWDEKSAVEEILNKELVNGLLMAINKRNEAQKTSVNKFSKTPYLENKRLQSENVIEDISMALASHGRAFSREFVVNLMICLTQGYIVTLAGMPGTGKTSLVKILSQVLGLAEDKDENGKLLGAGCRFTKISVERGWTSCEDFIGYYNPLTQTLVKSNPEICDAFRSLSDEKHDPVLQTPFYVLLDEANLSSIEHYWAPFLQVCDEFKDGDAHLSIGEGYQFALPEYLRFIATVNFDHTTEELSPRFLDRSWVILLDGVKTAGAGAEGAAGVAGLAGALGAVGGAGGRGAGVSGATGGTNASEPINLQPYSAQQLLDVFGPAGKTGGVVAGAGDKTTASSMASQTAAANKAAAADAASQAEKSSAESLLRIYQTCEEHRRPVSHRSQIMINNYVKTALRLNVAEKDAIDFCVLQKILPALNGADDLLKELLKKMSSEEDETFGAYERARSKAQSMLDAGEVKGFYQYFDQQ